MVYGLNVRQHTMYENTAAVYILFGAAKIPVTKTSAQYLLSTIIIYEQYLGFGTCLMDSLKHTLNSDGLLKRRLCIPRNRKVPVVLIAGYTGENILNKPVGYQPGIYWNDEVL